MHAYYKQFVNNKKQQFSFHFIRNYFVFSETILFDQELFYLI